MQECLIRLWKLETERPGRTRSWYLQNCRYHLQHCLAAGKSVDSLKRDHGDKRITIDGVNDELPAEWYHTNGELFEAVSARDIVSTLERHLPPRERRVLGGLADGLVLRDVAFRTKLSYPTVIKYRRKIAALTVKLGIALSPRKNGSAPPELRVNGNNGHADAQSNGHKRHDALPNVLSPNGRTEPKVNGRK